MKINNNNWGEKVSFIWSIAELLRGPYRPNQYKDVMLPLTVLRRLDCVLKPTKQDVLDRHEAMKDGKVKNIEPMLNKVSGHPFHNTSKFTFEELKGDPNNIASNLVHYIKSFSSKARDILEHFSFEDQIEKLEKSDRLFLIVSKFAEIDLHPDKVSNLEMGYIFEELIRRFNEASNEEAGDHFTPREVIALMVDLLFSPDSDILTTRGIVKTMYDPAAGTGGMLSIAEEYVRQLNPDATLELFGQDYNSQAYAICGSDMMIKGQNLDNIAYGDSFTEDAFYDKTFDYMLANPPFGVEWKPQKDFIDREHKEQGFGGRFGAGLPRVSDGALLFLQHMISKMKDPKEGGTRLGIVFNGSPLFTGGAGSGESEIRKWIIENDWLEAIVALPDQLFYNTGIHTYLWILTNRKNGGRKGKIQLIDGTRFYKKMRKSLGQKRHEVCDDQREEIANLHGDFEEGELVKIFDNEDFGYYRVTVERPLKLNFQVNDERLAILRETKAFQNLATSRKKKDKGKAQAEIEEGKRLQTSIIEALEEIRDKGVIKNREEIRKVLKSLFEEKGIKVNPSLFKAVMDALSERDENADICLDKKGNPEPDSELRDYENIPLKENIDEYMEREVYPYVPDAWIEKSKTKVGYEIPINRHFYKYESPRPSEEIMSEIRELERDILFKIKKVMADGEI